MAQDPWAISSVEDADPWDVVSEEEDKAPPIRPNPVRDALLAKKKAAGLPKLGSAMTPEAIGALTPETQLPSGSRDIPYVRAPEVDEGPDLLSRALAGTGPRTTGALETAERWNIPHNFLKSVGKTFSFNRLAGGPTPEDMPTARDVATTFGGLGAVPPVGEFIEKTVGPLVNPAIEKAYRFGSKYSPGALVRRALAPSPDEHPIASAGLLPARALTKGAAAMQDPANAVLMAAGGGLAPAAALPKLAAEGAFTGQMLAGMGPAWARVGDAYVDRGVGGVLQELPEAVVDTYFAASMGKKMGEHVAVDAPNHARNRAVYETAKAKVRANADYQERVAEREDLRGGTLQAAIDKAAETKAPADVARAAELKARADQLADELDGTPENPPVRPQPLTLQEEGFLQNPPKFGEALGGGSRDHPFTTPQNAGAGLTAEQIGAKLAATPSTAGRRIQVWDSVTDPGFLEAIDTPSAKAGASPRAEIERRLHAGEQPADISRTMNQPGFVTPDGTIHIMAPRIESARHLLELLDHESTHSALRLADLTGQAAPILGRAGTERALAALAARAKKGAAGPGGRVARGYEGATPSVVGEEVLAHGQEFVNTRQAPSVIDRAVASVRDRLRAGPLRGLVGKASDAEIRVMLARAQKFLRDHPELREREPGATKPTGPKTPTLDEVGRQLEQVVGDYLKYHAPFVESPEAIDGEALIRDSLAAAAERAKAAATPQRRGPTVAENEAWEAEAARNDAARVAAQQAETSRQAREAEAAIAPLEAARAARTAAEAERATGRRVLDEAQAEAARRGEEASREAEFRAAREAAEKRRQAEIRALQESGLGPTALAGALELPLGPEERRLKSTKKTKEQLPGEAPAKATPTTVPPAAGPTPEAAPPREAPPSTPAPAPVVPTPPTAPARRATSPAKGPRGGGAFPVGSEVEWTSMGKTVRGRVTAVDKDSRTVETPEGTFEKFDVQLRPTGGEGPRLSIRTALGQEGRARDVEGVSLAEEKLKARENAEHWVTYAVPEPNEGWHAAGRAALKQAFDALRDLGIRPGRTPEGVDKNGVSRHPYAGEDVIVTSWTDGPKKGQPEYAYAASPNGQVGWAYRFGVNKKAVDSGADIKPPTLKRLLEKTEPTHPYRVMQGELARMGVRRDPTTDAISQAGIATAELLAPSKRHEALFKTWKADPSKIEGRVRFEDGDHDLLSRADIDKGLEDLRTGNFWTREAHAVNMHALDAERKEIAATTGDRITTSEDLYGREHGPVLADRGQAVPPAEVGREAVPGAEPKPAGEGAGVPEVSGGGGLAGGEPGRGGRGVEPKFSMRGASAADADKKRLRTAQRLIRNGEPEEKVRMETGWHRGVDGRWRWEGPDNEARLNNEAYRRIPYVDKPGKNDGVRLGDVLQHDSLYRSYPQLAEVRVVNAPRPIGTTIASFDPKANRITLYPTADGAPGGPVSVFLHEMQHWVQMKEAFAQGGNENTVLDVIPPEDMRKIAEDAAVRVYKYADHARGNLEVLQEVLGAFGRRVTPEGGELTPAQLAEGMTPEGKRQFARAIEWGKTEQDIRRQIADERATIERYEKEAEGIRNATGDKLKAVVDRFADLHEYYRRLAGEVEARQTQARQKLTPEQRRNYSPVLDEDVPREKQIVDMGGMTRAAEEPAFSRRQEETPEFKEWFGDWEDPKAFSSRRDSGKDPVSHAVGPDGRPMVLYHGTQGDFGAFNTHTKGYNSNVFGSWETDRHAAFFAETPTDAEAYTEKAGDRTGANIRPVYLNAKAPIDFTKDGGWFEDFLREMDAEGVNPRWIRNNGQTWELFDGEDGRRFVDAAKRLGYDSVVFDDTNPDTGRPFRAWAVFDPNQVKSATGNSGAFGPGGDTRFSRRIPDEFQVAWEAIPGKSTTWLRGIHDAPYNVRNAFTADMDARVLRDKDGGDAIGKLLGVEETEQISAPGYWKPEGGPAENNPTRQVFVRVPEGADGMDRVRAYAAARGYVLRQEGVGIHLARNAGEGDTPNGIYSDLGAMPTPAQYKAYIRGLKAAAGEDFDSLVAVPSHNGINLWTWSDKITPERLGEINRDTLETVPGAGATTHPLVVDSDLVQNDWLKEPNGEGYARQFSAAPGPPDLQDRLDQLRDAADRVGREWASRHGWNTRIGAPEPAVPADVEDVVGREVKARGKNRQNLFKDLATHIDGRQLADMRFAAVAGKAARGWYRESYNAIRSLFGDDAERFTGLLAATSPQTGVVENLRIATRAWEAWENAGRPTDPEAIARLFPKSRYFDRSTGKWREKYGIIDLEARFNNAVTALSEPGAPLSGDKVESFRRNLNGDFDAVTNDTWMAYFSGWDQAIFGTKAGYLAGSYLVRKTAKALGWTPAEVQETVWTFFRELTNRADRMGRTAAEEMGAITKGEVLSGSDSFAHLVRDPDVQKRLSALGIDVDKLPDLPRLSPEEAAAPAAGPEAGPPGVSGRVARRAQQEIDKRWARTQLESADLDLLGEADYGALKKIADGIGIPTGGRSRAQIARLLQAHADPVRFSRRIAEAGTPGQPWDVPLTAPQVEARDTRLGIAQEQAAAAEPGAFSIGKLKRETPQPWSAVQPEADKIDLATSDEQWIAASTRKGKALDAAHQMAINKRAATRLEEFQRVHEQVVAARDMSAPERAAQKIDLPALIKEEMVKRLTYVAMEAASVNAGTVAARALAARAKIQAVGAAGSPDALVRKLIKELPDTDAATIAQLHQMYYESPGEFTHALRAAMRPSGLKKALEAYKAGLLSGLGTHVANITGNTIESAVRLAETLTAAGTDAVWAKMTGKPRERFAKEAVYELRGQLRAIPEAFRRFVDEFQSQILRQQEPSLETSGPMEYQLGAIGRGPEWLPFDAGAAVRTPFRALNIADRLFKAIGYEAELYKLAYRRARTEGFQGEKADARANMIIDNARRNMGGDWRSMMEQVERGMKDRVFQGDPVKLIRSVMSTVREHPGLGFVMPFLKTPSEITRLAWQRTPMGFLPGGRAWKTTHEYLRGHDKAGNEVERGQAIDALARPFLGTALATALSGLAANGFLTGSGPVDPKEKKLLQATGWQPYSLRIPKGDDEFVYIPYNRFEPISSLLGIVADGWEAKDERKMTDKVLGSVAQNFTNKLFWKGLNDMATAISSPDRNLKSIASSMVASAAVPTIVAKTAEAIDPVFRERRSGTGLTGLPEATSRAILRRIPGVSAEQEPIYTALGEPAERPGTAVTRFALPIQPTSTKPEAKVEEQLVALHAVPPPIPTDLAVPEGIAKARAGERLRVELTDQERAFLASRRRETVAILRKHFEKWLKMPELQRKEKAEDIFRDASRAAERELWVKTPALRERARALVANQ